MRGVGIDVDLFVAAFVFAFHGGAELKVQTGTDRLQRHHHLGNAEEHRFGRRAVAVSAPTILRIPDRCRYKPAQGWPDLHDSRFKNKDNFTANSG